MASFSGSPNPWADTYKDCSQGICSIYCPQWCYIIFPPPPPFFDFATDDGSNEKSSGSDFSPLIIAVIGILGSAFILLAYYTIISKYCRRRRSTGAVSGTAEIDGSDGAGQPASTFREGLEEGLIRSIRVYKYRSGDGFVDGADCAVCLSEFEENERLRLLPKCNHAFHVPCIDTWLKSHSSCPLCRADIAPFVVDSDEDVKNEVVVVVETSSVTSNAYRTSDEGIVSHVVIVEDDAGPKTGPAGPTERRSASLNIRDRFCSDRVSVADILRGEEEGEDRENGTEMCLGIGTSSTKGGIVDEDRDGDDCKYDRSGGRSMSTSRFVCSSRHGKGNNSLLI